MGKDVHGRRWREGGKSPDGASARTEGSVRLAFHYTVGTKLPAIMMSGALVPRGVDLEPAEREVLWFSTADEWEQTASKLIFNRRTGTLQRPTMLQLHALLGVFRFVISGADARLVAWPKLRRAAGMSDELTRRLVRNGREVGARPEDWRGSLVPIAIEEMQFEAWRPGLGWAPASLAFEARSRAALARVIQHAAASQIVAEDGTAMR